MLGNDTFYVWKGLAFHCGLGFPSDLHSHFALQILLGLDAPISLRSGEREEWRSYAAALVPSGVWHQTDSRPVHLAMIYLDPLSSLASAVRGKAERSEGIAGLPHEMAKSAVDKMAEAMADPKAVHETIIELVAKNDLPVRDAHDLRVARAVDFLDENADRLVSLHEISMHVGISPQRFRHLFREQMGISFSGYRLWNRVVYAIRLLTVDPNLTHAAHASGFADSAHFSRVFHRVFGMKPSDVFGRERFHIVLCD